MSILSIAAGGITAATDRFQRTANEIAHTGTGLAGASDNLADDMVEQSADQSALEANVTVARTADQMTGTLLNIIA